MVFRLRVMVVVGVVCTSMLVVLVGTRTRQDSMRGSDSSTLRTRADTSPALVGDIVDRDGRLVLSRKLVMDGGTRHAVLEHQYGRALDAVCVGRERVVGGLVRHLRAPGVVAPWVTPESRGVVRVLLGDGVLCPKPLPDELTVSLDARLCERVYELLLHDGREASVVVLNKDGEALALVSSSGRGVSRPGGSPAAPDAPGFFVSSAPASTLKPIVAAFMLQKALGDINAAITCRGGSACWTRHGVTRGLDQALCWSCNPWFRYQAGFFPSPDFAGFLGDVGYFQGPVPGVPPAPATELAGLSGTVPPETAIGLLHVATTPLSLACAYGTIIDPGGRRMVPRLVLKADGRDLPGPARPKVLRPEVTAQVRALLTSVASQGTAARLGHLAGTRVGAKTGTGRDAALLAVVAPAEWPEYIILIRVRGGSSGSNLCPLASKILHCVQDEAGGWRQ